ncbi:MAG TPA: hypothetical protein VI318_07700 [Baekduia sp.]
MRAVPWALLIAVMFTGTAMAAATRPPQPQGAPATCRHQSSAGFPTSARDLVVGPLVLVGARGYSSPEAIAQHGGQKYPALVLAGHRVTVELPRTVQHSTSLLYADDHWNQPDGPRTVGDGHRVVEFRSCATHRAGSSYGRRKATFWSGFMLTSVPRCLRLRIWVDDARTPREAHIPLGQRCV